MIDLDEARETADFLRELTYAGCDIRDEEKIVEASLIIERLVHYIEEMDT